MLALAVMAGCGDRVVVESTGGGASGGGGGAAGGAGGGDLGPAPRTITVVSAAGDPEAGIDVVAHDASGAVLDHQTTGPDGKATLVAPGDGMITVGASAVEFFPEADGTSEEVVHRELVTLAAIGAVEALTHRLSRPRERTHNLPMTVELTGSVPSADDVTVWMGCYDGGWLAMPVGTVSLPARGCPGEDTFALVLRTTTAAGPGELAVEVPYAAGSTFALSFDEAAFAPPTPDHVFEVSGGHALSVTPAGLDATGGMRMWVGSWGGQDGAPVAIATPPSTGVARWVVTEWIEALRHERWRTVTSLPASSIWTVEPVAAPTAPTPTKTQPPAASWTLGEGRADAVELVWLGGPPEHRWRLVLPPEATSATFPALPGAMQALVGEGGAIQVTSVDLDGDRSALFEHPIADQVRVRSDIVALP